MTSQLNVDTIVDKAGSGGTNVKVANTSTYVSDGGAVTQNTVQGLLKSWTVHDSASISDSFNTGSITDISSGTQEINFTNAMNNVSYAVAGLLGNNNNSASSTMNLQRPYHWQTSGYKIRSLYLTNTVADYSHTDTNVSGDLA